MSAVQQSFSWGPSIEAQCLYYFVCPDQSNLSLGDQSSEAHNNVYSILNGRKDSEACPKIIVQKKKRKSAMTIDKV